MLSSRLQDAINDQLNSELYSAHLYLSMAAYFEAEHLRGFAHWMRMQHDEEVSHAMRLFDYIVDRNGRAVMQAIGQPPTEFESVRSVIEMTLEHEREVTAMIEELYREADSENDYATQVLLEWFIEEQVEEEKSVTEIVDHLKLVGDDGTGLLILDSRLAARTAEPATGDTAE